MAASPKYRDLLRHLVSEEARPVHKYGHQPRLDRLSREIGAGLQYDDDVVFAAIWLHDLGVFEGNRPADLIQLRHWDHVRYAVERGATLLAQTDLPASKIPHVLAVIKEHQPGDLPSSIEASIVRDADILEQLGSVGVLRTAAKLGSDTRFRTFADARDDLRRKLVELPPKLQLARSRELAVPRAEALRFFLLSLDAEAGPDLG